MSDLRTEINATREAFIGAAVTEIGDAARPALRPAPRLMAFIWAVWVLVSLAVTFAYGAAVVARLLR